MPRAAEPRRAGQRRQARPRIALAPMLAVRGDQDGLGAADDAFLFSALPDGWRCLVVLDDRVRLRSRSGRDLAPELPEIAAALARLRPPGRGGAVTILDGLLVLPADDSIRLPAPRDVSSLEVVDVLCLAGRDLTEAPLRERVGALRGLAWSIPLVRCAEVWRGTLSASLAQVAPGPDTSLALLARRARSPYRPGQRHRDWVVFGGRRIVDMLLCGIATSGALVLGSPTPHGLVFAGVTRPTRLWRELAPRCREARAPFPLPRVWSSVGEIAWTEPDLWIAVEPDARPASGRGGPGFRFCRVQEDLVPEPQRDSSPDDVGGPA